MSASRSCNDAQRVFHDALLFHAMLVIAINLLQSNVKKVNLVLSNKTIQTTVANVVEHVACEIVQTFSRLRARTSNTKNGSS
jgi:hypothetical protein